MQTVKYKEILIKVLDTTTEWLFIKYKNAVGFDVETEMEEFYNNVSLDILQTVIKITTVESETSIEIEECQTDERFEVESVDE